MSRVLPLIVCVLAGACAGDTRQAATSAPARNVLLITIDTLRADHVGAYGDAAARTPSLDALARDGVRFDRAYAAAPLTIVSHATLMTGRYPPGHGARDNGMRIVPQTPTLADTLGHAGFATAAFVAAFPLDKRFGLNEGFQTYDDQMPRDESGRLANDRPGRVVVDRAIAWLTAHHSGRFFLWVHLFEPHAPYGDAADPRAADRPAIARYDDDVAEADRQIARLIGALGDVREQTLIVAAADHGEAFGEHQEMTHGLFVYDTTLRVPLILDGPSIERGRVVSDPVSLVDVAPTIAALAGLGRFDGDGQNLPTSGLQPPTSRVRVLYAESFAPLLDFGWSPLRTIRIGDWKYIAAPTAELYDLANDPDETRNLAAAEPVRAAEMAKQIEKISSATLPAAASTTDAETTRRLQALGYVSGGSAGQTGRIDPKDRREEAQLVGRVFSGEARGPELERTLRALITMDPRNPQVNLRLGYVLAESNRCKEAVEHFTVAIDAHLPSADPYLGRAGCEAAAGNSRAARATLTAARSVEPDNPVVEANLGLLLSDGGQPEQGIPYLEHAIRIDPDLHQARFALAIAYARTNRRGDAAREARALLERLPLNAPQRPEVARLLDAVR